MAYLSKHFSGAAGYYEAGRGPGGVMGARTMALIYCTVKALRYVPERVGSDEDNGDKGDP